MAQEDITVTVSLEQRLPLLKALATHLYRVDAFECVGSLKNKAGRRMKCDCFDCQPLTMEEACIRHLAGQDVDFRFING
jgi:hypothetical protein